MQWALRPGDIPIAAELASHFGEDSDGLESKPLMQFCRGRIRQRISGNDEANIFIRDRFEECGVKAAADPFADRVRAAIDCGLDCRLIRGFRPKARSPSVANDLAIFFRCEQAVSSGLRELLEPRYAALDHVRLDVESDGSVDDVVVVDLDETREIGGVCRADVNLAHAQFLFPSAAGQAAALRCERAIVSISVPLIRARHENCVSRRVE